MLPLDAGSGAAPARLANAASERKRPGCDDAARKTAAVGADPDSVEQRRRDGADQFPQGELVRVELVAEVQEAAGQTSRFLSGDVVLEVVGGARSPRGDLANGTHPERSSSVDPEVNGSSGGGQRVAVRATVSFDVATRGEQHAERRPFLSLTRTAQPVDVDAEHDTGGGFRIDCVRLPMTSLRSSRRMHLGVRDLGSA